MKKKSKTHPYLRQVHEDILELCGHVSDGKLLSRESLCLPPGQKIVQGHLPAATTNCWELKLHLAAAGRPRRASSEPPPRNYPAQSLQQGASLLEELRARISRPQSTAPMTSARSCNHCVCSTCCPCSHTITATDDLSHTLHKGRKMLPRAPEPFGLAPTAAPSPARRCLLSQGGRGLSCLIHGGSSGERHPSAASYDCI